ncbi:HAD-IIB family hydrolase [Saccharospirillum salsuginis]|uniref:Mannosyl-3-phosphoglycerate phosphatase n=1 Tax=Saccharospirillum salsuginis TaxID=418750 RepID=A0A918N652_9GAMM|nr:HAD-IIB family hydrolase [Saccharospirillum salsuginis]GGX38314.1 mannosyl-3-phosphoglycerate phosphatase [Saccharospirillum salsuginis]
MTDRWAVLTDLDGTLLDHDSYDWHPAEPALQRLRALNIPVIAVTSKTRAEMADLRLSIPDLALVFGCENGGVVVDQRSKPERVDVLGTPTEALVYCFERIRAEQDAPGLGFHEVSDARVAQWTGLPLDQAAKARRREASLPIYWPEDAPGRQFFIEAVERAGLRVLAGGRFLHLAGSADKGTALDRIRQLLGDGRPLKVMALGDSGNDDALLAAADWAVRLPPKHGPARPEPVSKAILASQPGPVGWNEAVLQWLQRMQPAQETQS